MREDLANISWGDLIGKDYVNSMGKILWLPIGKEKDKYVPICKSKKREYPEWMTRRVLKARKYKSRIWIWYRKSTNYNDLVK